MSEVAIKIVSPPNNDRINELNEFLKFAANSIYMTRIAKGEQLLIGDAALEAFTVASGKKVEVKENCLTTITIDLPLEEVKAELTEHMLNLVILPDTGA